MVDQVAEFLAGQKRFRCERLSADLTAQQCKANRQRVPNIQKGINPVISCEGCAGLGKAIEIKERVMAKTIAEIAAEKPWAVKVCTECQEPKKIHGHGQCAKCLYKKYGKAMKPPKEDPAPSAPPVKVAKRAKGKAVAEPVLSESGPFDGTCAACGRKAEGTIWSDECPFCMANPVTGAPMAVSAARVDFHATVDEHVERNPVKPLLKLLAAPPVLSMTLDFTNDQKLYAQLIEHGIDEDQVVELLSMLVSQELRRVA